MKSAFRNLNEIRSLARLASYWFLHPDFDLGTDENYNSFLGGLDFALSHGEKALKIGNIFKKSFVGARCKPSSSDKKKQRYCKLNEVLMDFETYASTLNFSPNIKIFNPSSNYKGILEHAVTTNSVFSKIEALKVGQEIAKNSIEKSLASFRADLGDYFKQLATFDVEKAAHDIAYLKSKMDDFNIRIVHSGISDKLSELFRYVLGAHTVELVQLVAELAVAIKSQANPLSWLKTGGGASEILDRANKLAQKGVDTARLAVIKSQILPDLIVRGNAIKISIAKNAKVHKRIAMRFAKLQNLQAIDVDKVQSSFLEDYGNYDPGFDKGSIAGYIGVLNKAIENLCDILYKGETAASAVVETIGASKAVCIRIQERSEILGAVYEEMYDFQYEFMEAMADATRALIAKHSAQRISNVAPSGDNILLRIYVYHIKLMSKQHILMALHDYCNVQDYLNGGVLTYHCKKALKNPTFQNIILAKENPVSVCPEDDKIAVHALIPAATNPLDDTILSLTQLYAGERTKLVVPFAASSSGNPTWVHRYLSPTIPVHKDIALYVKRFELFLPKQKDLGTYKVEVLVNTSQPVSFIGTPRMKYQFMQPTKFDLHYGENEESCPNQF